MTLRLAALARLMPRAVVPAAAAALRAQAGVMLMPRCIAARSMCAHTTGTGEKDVTRPRLGLSTKANKESTKLLTELMRSEFLLFMLLRDAHWAVQSTSFRDLHVMFEEQYQHADGVVDELAERIRTLGGSASVVPEELNPMSGAAIGSPPADFHARAAKDILKRVSEDTEAIVVRMRAAVRRIDELGEDAGSVDLLGTLIRQHEKHVWMLRAHLGE